MGERESFLICTRKLCYQRAVVEQSVSLESGLWSGGKSVNPRLGGGPVLTVGKCMCVCEHLKGWGNVSEHLTATQRQLCLCE